MFHITFIFSNNCLHLLQSYVALVLATLVAGTVMISIADGPSESVSGEKDDFTILVIKDACYYNEAWS